MAIDINQIATQLLNAMLPVLKKGATDVETFAKTEAQKIAQTVAGIGESLAAGNITPDQAKLLLNMKTTASRSVLTAVEGIGIVTAEQAINAGLGVVKQIVNTALGFVLI